MIIIEWVCAILGSIILTMAAAFVVWFLIIAFISSYREYKKPKKEWLEK
jgi:uncharacterized protein YggT (Ycf19 family)